MHLWKKHKNRIKGNIMQSENFNWGSFVDEPATSKLVGSFVKFAQSS